MFANFHKLQVQASNKQDVGDRSKISQEKKNEQK